MTTLGAISTPAERALSASPPLCQSASLARESVHRASRARPLSGGTAVSLEQSLLSFLVMDWSGICPLSALFRPEALGVFGASRPRSPIGGELFLIIRFVAGAIYSVSCNADVVETEHACRALADIPGLADLAVIGVPHDQMLSAIDETCEVSAFSQREFTEGMRHARMRMSGPSGLGLVSTEAVAGSKPPSRPRGRRRERRCLVPIRGAGARDSGQRADAGNRHQSVRRLRQPRRSLSQRFARAEPAATRCFAPAKGSSVARSAASRRTFRRFCPSVSSHSWQCLQCQGVVELRARVQLEA